MVWSMEGLSSEARSRQCKIGVTPGFAKASLDAGRGFAPALGPQALEQAEERPSVVRIALQVLTVDGLRIDISAGVDESRPMQLAQRKIPEGRLHVWQLVLQ